MENHLIIIGIDEYQHENQLEGCVNDVISFKNVLLEKYFFEEKNVIELFDAEATYDKITRVLKLKTEILDKNSNLIIYFSGHGNILKENNKEIGYWLTVDSAANKPGIKNREILNIISDSNAKHIVIIADCCYAMSLLLTKNAKSSSIDLDSYNSRWMLASGREITYDGSKNENSLFCEAIINCLANAEEHVGIGTLIEYVKRAFKGNIFQKPQGYPLLITNHNGGEYFFKIKTTRKLGKLPFRGYDKFELVIKTYVSKPNNLSEDSARSPFEEKKLKIGYRVLKEEDKIKKQITYYLYLYEGVSQTNTLKHLKAHYPELFEGNTILFIPKEKNQVHFGRRKENIDKSFKPLNIFYIDEFIEDLTKQVFEQEEDIDDEKYLVINNFIKPSYRAVYKKFNVNSWLRKKEEPLLVIKGSAGIGKTTYVRYISDLYSKNVIFLSLDHIRKALFDYREMGQKLDLYQFYKAIMKDEKYLEKELFSLSLDAGTILLVIDGLDEIISTVNYFDINIFFQSILNNTSGLGNTKIIVTTRSYFWNDKEFKDHFNVIELLPFDEQRTEFFFKKSFNNDNKKVRKAIKIANDFSFKNEDNILYQHPFVLSLINDIVKSNDSILIKSNFYDSDILDPKVRIDFVLYHLCTREIKRVDQINVNDQINFFIDFAVKHEGVLKSSSIKSELIKSLKIEDINDRTIEALKSHAFLTYSTENKRLLFKFDFFESYFISLFIFKAIDINNTNKVELNTNIIKLFAEKLFYGSETIKHIVNRIFDTQDNWTDDYIATIGELIEKIIRKKKSLRSGSEIEIKLANQAISGLFNLALFINFKYEKHSIYHNTQLIHDIFLTEKNTIENLIILNLNDIEFTIRFDFSNLTLYNCIINGYSNFWNCKPNENTYFYYCELKNLGNNFNQIKIPKANFIECDSGRTFDEAFDIHNNLSGNKQEIASKVLENFLKIFYKNSKFRRLTDSLVESQRGFLKIKQYKLKSKDILNILFHPEINILIKEKDKSRGDVKIMVRKEIKADILKFITEGKTEPSILQAMAKISIKL